MKLTEPTSLLNSLRKIVRIGDRQRRVRTAQRRYLPALDALEGRVVLSTVSSIASNFNGTRIPAGDTIWFNSVFTPNGQMPTGPFTISVSNASVTLKGQGVNETLSAPNASITFSPTATQASTTFDAAMNTWNTTLPTSHLSGNDFLDGFGFQVPAGGLPGGINSVTWTASFSTTATVNINWQWAAAVYTTFSSDQNALGVKPVDDNHASQYMNSDHAGTPENFTSSVIGGARGGGGSNFTGSYSATGSVTPTVQIAQPPADLSGFVTGVRGVPLPGVSVTLTGTDDQGNAVNLTVMTNDQGFYEFSNLVPGMYTVERPTAPGVPINRSQVGTDNGMMDGSLDAGGNIVQIVLAAGDVAINYDFGVVLA